MVEKPEQFTPWYLDGVAAMVATIFCLGGLFGFVAGIWASTSVITHYIGAAHSEYVMDHFNATR